MKRHHKRIAAGSQAGKQSTASFANEMGEVAKTQAGTQSHSGAGSAGDSKVHGVQAPGGDITVTESDSGAHIELRNAKAQIDLDPSGHLTVKSNSGSGITVQAGAGSVAVEGVEVVVKSAGNLQLDSGADLNLNAKGGLNLTTPTGAIQINSNSLEQNINGLYTMNITKEYNLVVGGHMRTTIAGDHRQQVSGNSFYDTEGDHKFRSTGEMVLNTKDSLNMFAELDSSLHVSDGLLQVRVSKNLETDVGETWALKADKMEEDAVNAYELKAKEMTTDITELWLLKTADTTIHATANLNMFSGISRIDATLKSHYVSPLSIHESSDQLHFRSPIIYQNSGNTYMKEVWLNITGGGTNGYAPQDPTAPVNPNSPDEPEDPQAPEKAQTLEPEAIQDELSTLRKDPDYPYNGKRRTNAGASRMRNSSDKAKILPSGGEAEKNIKANKGDKDYDVEDYG